MGMRNWSLGCGLALAGTVSACGAPPPEAQPAQKEVSEAPVPVMGPKRRILAFGDSLFAGYNVGREESYPVRLQAALRAQGVNAQVSNAGVSGDTTAAGLQRLAFTLDAQKDVPDLVIVELGGNDLLRGLPVEQTRRNMTAIVDLLRGRGIPVLLMGMRAPPNLGGEYVASFDRLYPELAARDGVELVPFWLESIYQRQDLFQGDRVHPTADGIEELVRATVDDVAAALPDPEGS